MIEVTVFWQTPLDPFEAEKGGQDDFVDDSLHGRGRFSWRQEGHHISRDTPVLRILPLLEE